METELVITRIEDGTRISVWANRGSGNGNLHREIDILIDTWDDGFPTLVITATGRMRSIGGRKPIL